MAKTYADLFGYGAKSRPYQFYHKPGGAKARPLILYYEPLTGLEPRSRPTKF